MILCAELSTDRPRHVVATIAGEVPGALAQHMDGRVYALLPAAGGDGAPEDTLDQARKLATKLQRHGTVGVSSSTPTRRSWRGRSRRPSSSSTSCGSLMRMPLISRTSARGPTGCCSACSPRTPEEVRSFFEDTVAPIVRYDDQYRTDLVGTLEAYLEQNCNMNATAAAISAHRHTVAYRLERVKELTALDPMQSEDPERLGLGLKAYRIIAPQLPK